MIALVIVNRGKRLGLHDIHVEPAVEMIDLVLQNPRIPAGRSITLGSPRSSRHVTRTEPILATIAINRGMLRQPS